MRQACAGGCAGGHAGSRVRGGRRHRPSRCVAISAWARSHQVDDAALRQHADAVADAPAPPPVRTRCRARAAPCVAQRQQVGRSRSAWRPGSRPQVGWKAMPRRGCRSNSRASAHLLLVAARERVARRAFGPDAGATSNAAHAFDREAARAAPRLHGPRREKRRPGRCRAAPGSSSIDMLFGPRLVPARSAGM